VFAPIGGFQAVTDAMVRLTNELGVDLRCNTTVLRVDRDGVFIRDKQGHRFVAADVVIVNADLPYAKKSLFKAKKPSKSPIMETYDWDDKLSFSSGVVSFHWCLDKPLADLNTHNVFLMAGSRSLAEASWQVLRPLDHQHTNSSDEDTPFNFYVHRPTATDPTAAPGGYDSIMVLVPCRTLVRDEKCYKLPRELAIEQYKAQFSDEMIARMRNAVFKRLGKIESLANIEKHIIHEFVDTPATWADQFNLAAGTPFALVRRISVFLQLHMILVRLMLHG
jgi:phytoene dehydrogenase-like protein